MRICIIIELRIYVLLTNYWSISLYLRIGLCVVYIWRLIWERLLIDLSLFDLIVDWSAYTRSLIWAYVMNWLLIDFSIFVDWFRYICGLICVLSIIWFQYRYLIWSDCWLDLRILDHWPEHMLWTYCWLISVYLWIDLCIYFD